MANTNLITIRRKNRTDKMRIDEIENALPKILYKAYAKGLYKFLLDNK